MRQCIRQSPSDWIFEQKVAERRLLRKAFDKIRRSPEHRETRDQLAGALGGRYIIDRRALELAQAIIDGTHGGNNG